MSARIGIPKHLQALGRLLGLEGNAEMPKIMGDQPIQGSLDIGQGGFMARQVVRGANYSPGINIGGINTGLQAFISPSPTENPFILSNDGKDRRVLAADLTVDFVALGYAYAMEVKYFLKADPDEVAEFPVMFMRWLVGDPISTRHSFPLTGTMMPAANYQYSDGVVTYPAVGALACSWDGIVPAGWGFYGQVAAVSAGVAANFPANTNLKPSFYAVEAPAGVRLAR